MEDVKKVETVLIERKEHNNVYSTNVPAYPSDWVYIPGVNDAELAKRVKASHERIKLGEVVDGEIVMKRLEQILGG